MIEDVATNQARGPPGTLGAQQTEARFGVAIATSSGAPR